MFQDGAKVRCFCKLSSLFSMFCAESVNPDKAGAFFKVVCFRKNVPYDNIKSHKKISFTLSLDDIFFKKPQGGEEGGQIDSPQPF